MKARWVCCTGLEFIHDERRVAGGGDADHDYYSNVDERLRPATVSEGIVFSITWADMIRGEREDSGGRVTVNR